MKNKIDDLMKQAKANIIFTDDQVIFNRDYYESEIDPRMKNAADLSIDIKHKRKILEDLISDTKDEKVKLILRAKLELIYELLPYLGK